MGVKGGSGAALDTYFCGSYRRRWWWYINGGMFTRGSPWGDKYV